MDDYNAARDYMLQMANEISRLRAENEKLRAALKNLLADVQDYERANNLYPNPGRSHCWESVRAAAAALKETE